MGVIDKISLNLSTRLGDRLDKDEEEKAVLNYGLFMIIHTFLGIILTILVGLITGMIIEMSLITITSALFKRYTGGVHASTPEICLIIGIILSLILSIIVIVLIFLVLPILNMMAYFLYLQQNYPIHHYHFHHLVCRLYHFHPHL